MKKRLIGQHWFEVAIERIRAGEDEKEVMADYGYEYKPSLTNHIGTDTQMIGESKP